MKFIILSALFFLHSTSLFALELQNKGEFRLRQDYFDVTEGRANLNDFTTMRVRLGFDLDIGEGRKIFFSPQAVQNFGEDSTTVLRSKEVTFYEGYADVPILTARLKAGRQAIAYGEQRVIGKRNWTADGQSLDGFKLSHELWSGEVDLGYFKIANTQTDRFSDDVTLTYLYYKVLRTASTELDGYFFRNNSNESSRLQDTLSAGFRYKLDSQYLGLTTENIVQKNEGTKSHAYHLNLSLDKTYELLKFFVNSSLSSRDYDQLYGNRHAFHGIIDILGRRNLLSASLGAVAKISPQYDLKLEIFQFRRASKSAPAYRLNGTTAITGNLDDADLAQEVDLILRYRPRSKESLELAASAFLPGDYLKTDDTNFFLSAQYTLNF